MWRHVSENCNIQASKKTTFVFKIHINILTKLEIILFIPGLFNDAVVGLDRITVDVFMIIE